jgi:hypothetical protein
MTNILYEQKHLYTTDVKMAEKDRLECRILSELFSDGYISENFVFAGGGSLSKAYRLSPRIGQDIDLACSDFEELPDNRTGNRLRRFNDKFKEFVFDVLKPKFNYIINQDQRFLIVTDREWRSLNNNEQWLTHPVLHILYKSEHDTSTQELCIEIIPRQYQKSAISYKTVVPYSTGVALNTVIPTAAYEQTFWDKIFALHCNSVAARPRFDQCYSRHYYDVAILAPRVVLDATQNMLTDIAKYQARHTTRGISPDIKTCDINLLPNDAVLYKLEDDYTQMAAKRFIAPAESWNTIVQKLQSLNQDLKTL